MKRRSDPGSRRSPPSVIVAGVGRARRAGLRRRRPVVVRAAPRRGRAGPDRAQVRARDGPSTCCPTGSRPGPGCTSTAAGPGGCTATRRARRDGDRVLRRTGPTSASTGSTSAATATGERRPSPSPPNPTSPPAFRYADGVVTADGELVLCVREWHGAPGADEARNELVVLPTDGSSDPTVLVGGVRGPRLRLEPPPRSARVVAVLVAVEPPRHAVGRRRAVGRRLRSGQPGRDAHHRGRGARRRRRRRGGRAAPLGPGRSAVVRQRPPRLVGPLLLRRAGPPRCRHGGRRAAPRR